MTEYPYNFGNGYKVQVVYANKTTDGGYGDIYDFRSEVEHEHPGAEVLKGYCVIDEALDLVPDGCNDWNENIPAAIQDYEDHVVPYLNRNNKGPKELLRLFEKDYIDSGYLYSGSWPYTSLLEDGFSKEVIEELIKNEIIQKRKCDELAYELTSLKRLQLLSKHSLCSRWYEEAGNAYLDDIATEVRNVSLVKPSTNNKELITVDTLKVVGDNNKPDKVDVKCPFTVGQVVALEYDLPQKQKYRGYALSGFTPGGTAVGKFMVTDIMCNLLVNPPVNMIEFQSLSAEFNKVHSDTRTMLVFEDVALKRLKSHLLSLDEKIDHATLRVNELKSEVIENEKGFIR